jgi:hypothetical protein
MRQSSDVLRITLLAGVCCLLGLISAKSVRADNVYGKIRGTVTDPSGAVIAGAKVTATNTATGISATVKSGTDGSYEFLQLAAPAIYTVKVEQAGFRAHEAQNLSLSLDQIYVLNVKMEVGTVSQQVTVEAAPAQVETTSMQLGKVISAQTITSMPLNGRNWVQLQQTIPGVVASSDRFTNNYSTNGSRSQSNDYLVNGVDANDLPLNSIAVQPSPDAIAEVSVVTNTINPEYGRNGGAVLNAETKSGSNQIHGTGFEFYRDTSLNTRNFFSPSSTIFHQNQFGGVIGGPIKKNKAFFFFAYQGTRNRQPDVNGGNSTTVFDQQQRSGDFSGDLSSDFPAFTGNSAFPLVGSNGASYPAGTPYATIFPTGQIPVSDFNGQASNLTTKFVPLPNAPGSLYEFNPVTKQSINQYITRVDFNLTSKDSLYFYWFVQPLSQTDVLPFTGSTLPGFGDQDVSHTQQYALPWVHTFGGTMVNEARLGYQRFNFQADFPQQVVQPASVGFPGINPNFPGGASYPKIDLSGGGYFILGGSNNGPQPRIDQTFQFNDNFSWVKGRHTMKFGFQVRRSMVNTVFNNSNNGTFTYDGAGTYSTGDVAADFLLGLPDSYAQGSGNYQAIRTYTFYTYAQDQFKLRPNLTLTYGVGWEIDTPLTAVNNGGVEVNCYRPGVQSTVFPTAPPGIIYPGDPTCNSAAGATTKYNHFGPRFGFAWSPGNSSKWSIRGGYGIYFNRSEEELALQNLTPPPFAITGGGVGNIGLSPSFTAPYTAVTGQSIPNQFPFTAPAPGAAVNFNNIEPFSLNVVDPNLTVPYSQNYNLTVERQLPASMILSFGYVGLQGRKLTTAVEQNPAGSEAGNPICAATPNCNSFSAYAVAPQSFRNPLTNTSGVLVFGSAGQQATSANSNYNSLQVSLSKKFSHGLALQSSYVWSHSLDFASSFEDLGFSGVRGTDPFNAAANYGDSEFDARQRFVISYTYYIPSPWHSGVAGVVANGWQMSGITTFQTGFPVTIGDSSVPSATCDATFVFYSCWDRPNTVAPVQIYNPRGGVFTYNGATKPNHYFDPNPSFSAADPFTLGNASRNFFHGPGVNNFDWALHKVTPLHSEKAQLELRFEFFNLFNHTQFTATPGGAGSFHGSVSGNFVSSNFGRSTGASNPFNSRIIQLGAKIIF